MIGYGFSGELSIPFERTVEQVTERLKDHGFGVPRKIYVRETLREKLDIDFKDYSILGACNPATAPEAILAEDNVGLLLPCSVIVHGREGKTVISVARPTVAVQMVNNSDLQKSAAAVEIEPVHVPSSIRLEDSQNE